MVIGSMFLRPDGSFVPSVESGKAERQAAKPSDKTPQGEGWETPKIAYPI